MIAGLEGFARERGPAGVRDHVLVLPSVVCASHAARTIAEAEAVSGFVHQHGCLHVGDDLRSTEAVLLGTALNPNVRGVVVVSLGCETLNGARLAKRIAAQGQVVELVGIQDQGGTASAIAAGRAAVGRLPVESRPGPIDGGEVTVGIDRADDPLAGPLIAALRARGLHGAVPPDGLVGPPALTALCAAGAQILVTLPGADEAPTGLAICPVVAVGRDHELHRGLADDFDAWDRGGDLHALADQLAAQVLTHAGGVPTASETRGDASFVLHRLAMTL